MNKMKSLQIRGIYGPKGQNVGNIISNKALRHVVKHKVRVTLTFFHGFELCSIRQSNKYINVLMIMFVEYGVQSVAVRKVNNFKTRHAGAQDSGFSCGLKVGIA